MRQPNDLGTKFAATVSEILRIIHTAWEKSKYGVISGPYFPVLGLNSVFGKHGPEKTPYLDTSQAVSESLLNQHFRKRYKTRRQLPGGVLKSKFS